MFYGAIFPFAANRQFGLKLGQQPLVERVSRLLNFSPLVCTVLYTFFSYSTGRAVRAERPTTTRLLQYSGGAGVAAL